MQLYTHTSINNKSESDFIKELCTEARVYATDLEKLSGIEDYCTVSIDASFIASCESIQIYCRSLLYYDKTRLQLAFYRALQDVIIADKADETHDFSDMSIDVIMEIVGMTGSRLNFDITSVVDSVALKYVEKALHKCGYCGYDLGVLSDKSYASNINLFDTREILTITRTIKKGDSEEFKCLYRKRVYYVPANIND